MTKFNQVEIIDCGDSQGNRYQLWTTVTHPDDTTRAASEFICSTTTREMAETIAQNIQTEKSARVLANLTSSDATEIYYALNSFDVNGDPLVGVDGELLATGKAKITADNAHDIFEAVWAKKDRLQQGCYDDYNGEVKKPRSETGKWARQMAAILVKIGPDGKNLVNA